MYQRKLGLSGAVAALTAFVLMLGGCGSGANDSAPTTEEFSRLRKELSAKNKKQGNKKRKKSAVAAVAQPAGESDLVGYGRLDLTFSYDEEGKRDPFRSYKWDQLALNREMDDARGPLEQFDIAQLALVAVVWNAGAARALVQDPSGMAYVVGQGSKIGKNEGRVVGINDNLLTVKETYVDYRGQETTQDIEMRIRTEG